MVGKSPNRYDIPGKVDATQKWAVDVKLPGMVHARNGLLATSIRLFLKTPGSSTGRCNTI